jgi:hypothetical protein
LVLPGLPSEPLAVAAWWTYPRLDWVARKLGAYAARQRVETNHMGWLLIGAFVGRGPMNEALVADWAPVALLEPMVLDDAERRYHRRVTGVGRDHS